MKLTALAAAVAFAIGLTIGAGATGSHYRHKIAALEGQRIEREAAIASAVMETKLAQIQQIHGALDAAQKQTIQARADADRANDANRRLRQSLADYRARHANTTASTGQGEPDSDPVGVLAELLGRMGEAGQRVSRYADEVKIAGAACEAAR
jgi:ribosomal protein S12 methylthiotransferase accessory factor YcaO